MKTKASISNYLVIVFLMIAFSNSTYSQVLSERKLISDYKYFICDIIDGDINRAIQMSLNELKKDSANADIDYTLCISYAQKKDTNKSIQYFKSALKKGLPFEQFLAGPRQLLKPLYSTYYFQEYLLKNPVELLQGPMLGVVTSKSAKFWIRTYNEVSFEIRVFKNNDKSRKIVSSSIGITSVNNDYTGIATVIGLNPDMAYSYQLIINNKIVDIKPQPVFRTYPVEFSKNNFQVVFGGGSSFNPKYETMWDTILSHKPLAFLSLGDFTYFNIADVPDHQKYIYYRRESRSEFRRLAASTPMYFIYDDHDFGGNDCIGGPEIDMPAWKNNVVFKIFTENTVNPSYGSDNHPGCWHKILIGDVEFFMLDGRYYRTDPKSKDSLYIDKNAKYPSMLGSSQKKWLFDAVKKSKALFKIIVSPVHGRMVQSQANCIRLTED